ncbi:PAS domain S-box-containing protein [Mucilaginibacter gracilis]|uniref:histidine kinase n=1 Tax=Mucilaginibacter gracilis TaxID=423350 RepID=A0A495J7X9_9SPHI|nr:PAS domain S-box protein [Mucilaginibacter gracilis]RKR84987.1 PAS domain S-box-containing protein [Mucilaginibacter gracilis]
MMIYTPKAGNAPNDAFLFNVKERSDRLMNYFLMVYFVLGLIFALFYGTWLIAVLVGSLSLIAYYSTKLALPNSTMYQYVLSAVFGIFMAQFIYQMHGMFEMHFFAFIGGVLLITYQKWRLQIPMVIVVILHHALFSYLQNSGMDKIYFSQLYNFDVRTFVIHVTLASVLFYICGLWAYQLKKYNELHLSQTLQMAELQKESLLLLQREQYNEERSTILESIGDAFFAVDKDWVVTYWNQMAEKILSKPKSQMLNSNFWDNFDNSTNSISYQKYKKAVETNQSVHFQDYYEPLDNWYDVSAYPSEKGLSVYFKDITERKRTELLLIESEKKYSDLFQLSPLPKWVFDVETLRFLDVNTAAIEHYGYTKEEFMGMTIRDIRPVEEVPKLEADLAKQLNKDELTKRSNFWHKKKNGELIEVDVQSRDLVYKSKKARLIIANDITEKQRYIKAIEEQNDRLREISWIQSHIVRAPLARILGLVPLIENPAESLDEKEKMLEYMLQSARDLDDVIKNITEKTTITQNFV